MPRPTIDIGPFRLQIEEWKRNNTKDEDILRLLKEEFDLNLSRTTLWRNLKQWSFSPRPITQDSDHLRQRIRDLTCDLALNDHFTLLQLHSEGFIITKTGLIRIRKELGLKRRRTDPNEVAQLKEDLLEFFRKQHQESTTLQYYGRTYLYTFVRQKLHMLSRRAIYESFRDFMPSSITDRWNTLRYRRVGWTAPGPDFIWSLDAYDKLKSWGFEVYAAIDAYSRMIVWFYCGVSSSTSRSVLAQYLNVLEERGKMPNLIRSDRGRETILMAAAHYYLAQTRVRVRDGIMQDINFRDCWVYGKSTHNEKIESWWHRLSQGRSGFWRVRMTAYGYIYTMLIAILELSF